MGKRWRRRYRISRKSFEYIGDKREPFPYIVRKQPFSEREDRDDFKRNLWRRRCGIYSGSGKTTC